MVLKKIVTLICIIYTASSFAQVNESISVFHRLLIYNADNEIMLVKFKGTDTWITPGFYQDSTQFIKEGLHNIAATYGMTITDPELKGIFLKRREIGETKEMQIRNMYRSNYVSGELHFPKNQSFEIGEIKWLPIKEALLTISFESVRMFVKQVDKYPDVLWGGSIRSIREDNTWRYEIVEKFYPLFSPK